SRSHALRGNGLSWPLCGKERELHAIGSTGATQSVAANRSHAERGNENIGKDPMHWFANPLTLTLLALLPAVLVLALLTARRRRRILARFGASPAIKGLATKGTGTRWLRGIGLVGGLALLIVAIAGPQWGRDWEQSAAPGRDIV